MNQNVMQILLVLINYVFYWGFYSAVVMWCAHLNIIPPQLPSGHGYGEYFFIYTSK